MSAYRDAAVQPEPHTWASASVVTTLTDIALANLRFGSGRASEDFYQRIRFPILRDTSLRDTSLERYSDVEAALASNYDCLVVAIEVTERYVEQHPDDAVLLYPWLFAAQALAEEFEPWVLKRRTLERLQTPKSSR